MVNPYFICIMCQIGYVIVSSVLKIHVCIAPPVQTPNVCWLVLTSYKHGLFQNSTCLCLHHSGKETSWDGISLQLCFCCFNHLWRKYNKLQYTCIYRSVAWHPCPQSSSLIPPPSKPLFMSIRPLIAYDFGCKTLNKDLNMFDIHSISSVFVVFWQTGMAGLVVGHPFDTTKVTFWCQWTLLSQ